MSGRRLPRRLTQLFVGLALYGVSTALLVRAGLGLAPWDVLHQGLAEVTGIAIGWWTILVGIGLLLLWIPLRQRPGFGTLANAIVIGLVVNAVLAAVPDIDGVAVRALVMVVAIALNAVATAAYIGAALGPGPRDGLMTGIAARGHSVRVVRTAIEITVLAIGAALGGTLGVGTVGYALGIGPLVHVLLPRMAVQLPAPPAQAELRGD